MKLTSVRRSIAPRRTRPPGYGKRDTQLAIVMPVRERDLTGVMDSAREALEGHGPFVAWGQLPTETELRAT